MPSNAGFFFFFAFLNGLIFNLVSRTRFSFVAPGSIANLESAVKQLNKKGIVVEAIGSFDHAQLRFSTGAQTVGGKTYPATKGVMFYHGLESRSVMKLIGVVGDQIMEAIRNKSGPFDPKSKGPCFAMFNLGFLIEKGFFSYKTQTEEKSTDPQKRVEEMRELLKASGVKCTIAGYVQEYDISADNLKRVIALVNANKDVFNGGFAWGGPLDAFYTKGSGTGTAKQFFLSK